MKKLDNKGFGAIEGLLIFVIVGIIGGTSFYVYRQKQAETKKSESPSVSKVNKTTKTEETSKEESKKASTIDYTDFKSAERSCGLSYSSDLGKLSEKTTETAVQGKYSVLSFSNEDSNINLYCAPTSSFGFKFFSGWVLKVQNGKFILKYSSQTKKSEGTDLKIGNYTWHRVSTGDAGYVEHVYFAQTTNDKVVGFGFNSENKAQSILPKIKNLN